MASSTASPATTLGVPINRPTAVAYAELQLAYDTFNRLLFDNSLDDCLLTLQRNPQTMGYFSPGRFGNRANEKVSEIALNPDCFAVVPVIEILATIAHEMCHLWQHQHGTPSRGRYHDREWGDKMESIGLMPSATGRPGGRKTGDKMADYPIEGGRFLAVCSALLTENFQISWYDRFSTLTPVRSGASTPGIVLNLPEHATITPVAAGLPMAPAPTLAAANKSNRSKYSCRCGTNVWGKPGLNITCGDCEEAFDEAA